jgi:hypothetical protein
MADYVAPHISFPQVQSQLDANAGAQSQTERLFADRAGDESSEYMSTMLPMDSKPDLPPTMKNWTRWQYLEEFVGYWKYEHMARVIGISLLVIGFLMLNVFLPGALVTIAVAARQIDLAWWYGEIARRFGQHRSLVLVD